MYSRWDIPRDSPKPHDVTQSHVVIVYIASFSAANQHSVSCQSISILNLIRPCPPAECINHGTCHVPFILTLTIRQTTATPHHLLHQCRSIHPPAASACIHVLASTACSTNYTTPQCIHLHLQGKFLHLSCRSSGIFHIARSRCKLILLISDGGSQL